MLASFTADFPNVNVRIVEGLSGTLADWVRADEVDFAICNRPAVTHGLDLQLLLRDDLVLVSGRAKRLTPFQGCRLGQVENLRLVLPSRNHTLRHTLDEHMQRGDFHPVQTLEIDGQSATLQFVAHSDWSTILPRIALVHEFDSTRFCLNPILQPQLATEIYALRSAHHHNSAAAERFIAALEVALQAAPLLPSSA